MLQRVLLLGRALGGVARFLQLSSSSALQRTSGRQRATITSLSPSTVSTTVCRSTIQTGGTWWSSERATKTATGTSSAGVANRRAAYYTTAPLSSGCLLLRRWCLVSSLLISSSAVVNSAFVSRSRFFSSGWSYFAGAAAAGDSFSSPFGLDHRRDKHPSPPHSYSSTTTQRRSIMSSLPRTERTQDRPDDTLRITVTPAKEPETSALVVISHGLGDTAEGFVDVAEHLAKKMPYVKFILPTAKTQPVTLNMGMSMPSWYDIVGLDERSNEQCDGIEESQQRLLNILEQEHADTGLPYSRMVLMGFSQGGALSLYTGLQLEPEKALAGIALMSGYLPHASAFKVNSPDVPVWHGHGTQDMVVAFPLADKSRSLVMGRGCKSYTVKKYPIAHTVSMPEIEDIYGFLQKILPDDPSHRIKMKDPSEMSVKELRAAIRKAGLSSQAVGLMEKSEFVKLLKDHYSSSTSG